MLARLQLDFRPDLTQISNLHRFVCDFLSGLLQVEEDPDRIALTVFELVENVIKYSTDGRGCLDLTVDSEGEEGRIEIKVHSLASAKRVDELAELVRALRAEEDAMALYLRWMLESARRNEGSGLGLARIRAEAEMDVDLELDGTLPPDQHSIITSSEGQRAVGQRLVTLTARTTVALRRPNSTNEAHT